MKSTELRIGNLVQTHSKNIFTIQEVGTNHIIAKGLKPEGFNYQQIESIPLTEEWLLKAGFIKEFGSSYNYWKIKSKHSSFVFVIKQHPKYSEEWAPSGKYFMEPMGIFYDYVHQLQNLYFALTNTELQFKKNELPSKTL